MKAETLAERLRVIRAKQGLTLVQAAEKIGIDRHTLRDLELGRRRPNFDTVEKLSTGYGVPVAELMEAEEAPLGEAPSQRPPSVETKAGPTSVDEDAAVLSLVIEEAVFAEPRSLEDLSEDLLVRTLARLAAARRVFEGSDAEEVRRKGGEFTNRVTNAIALELNRRRGAYREHPRSPPHPRYGEITSGSRDASGEDGEVSDHDTEAEAG